MRPYVICHMEASLDGGLHPSRFTRSPQGGRAEWSAAYERVHQELKGDAWLVGRVTMAEMSKAQAHPPASWAPPERPRHFAGRGGPYAVAVDTAGKLHFAKPDIGCDPVVVLLGAGVADSHLAELAADGVSYIVAPSPAPDLAEMLSALREALSIERLLLEGGAAINGAFFAAGLVDELSLLVAPALDGRAGSQSFVQFGETGLAGKTQLSLLSCQTLSHGILHLRYSVQAEGA